jgi:hypothetical protein
MLAPANHALQPYRVSRRAPVQNETLLPWGGALTIRQSFSTPVVKTLLRFRPCPEASASEPMTSFRRINSPVALATCGMFLVPEPFGACLLLAAAIWWLWRKTGCPCRSMVSSFREGVGRVLHYPALIRPATYSARSSRTSPATRSAIVQGGGKRRRDGI